MTTKTTPTTQLTINQIHFDERVNRAIVPSRVAHITKNFDPAAVGVLTVSARDNGTYVVLDGQHRLAAMRAVGWNGHKITCRVHKNLSIEQEAALFLQLNDTRKPTAMEQFTKRVVAGDPTAVAIDKIVNAAGLTVGDGPVDGSLQSIRGIERIYSGDKYTETKANGQALADTLRVVTEAWGFRWQVLNGDVITGVGLVVLRYQKKVDLDILTSRLAAFPGGSAGVLGRARGLRDIKGSSIAAAVAAVVVDTYNKGRRSNALADWWR